MPSQTGKNTLVAYKVEAAFNTAPGTGGAKKLRLTGGGLSGRKALITSNEIRSDGQTAIARHGSRNCEGSYPVELSVGSFDELLEAVMRSTWVPNVAITVDGTAPNTSFQVTSTSQITYVGTTTILTKGLRRGDVVRLTNMSTAANNNINLRVKAIDAAGLVIDFFGTPLTVQAADSAATMTIQRKLKRAAAPTRRSFYFEEYDQDIDASEVFGGCRIISLRIVGTPDGMATVEFGILGASFATLSAGSAPYYVAPTEFTSVPLVFADALIAFSGADIAIATAFELNLQITAKTEPVIGSSFSPDVFDNDARLTGSLSLIRQDLTKVQAFADETEFEFHVLLAEPEAEPKDFIAVYVPRIKLATAESDIGGDGAKIDQLNFTAGMKEGAAATGYDDTMLTISTSAA